MLLKWIPISGQQGCLFFRHYHEKSKGLFCVAVKKFTYPIAFSRGDGAGWDDVVLGFAFVEEKTVEPVGDVFEALDAVPGLAGA